MPFLAAPPAVDLTTAVQTLYTCPNGFRVIAEANVSNKDASNPVTVTLAWTDVNGTPANVSKNLVFTDIAAKDAIAPKRKVLEPGDTITGQASANGYAVASIDITHSEPVT